MLEYPDGDEESILGFSHSAPDPTSSNSSPVSECVEKPGEVSVRSGEIMLRQSTSSRAWCAPLACLLGRCHVTEGAVLGAKGKSKAVSVPAEASKSES